MTIYSTRGHVADRTKEILIPRLSGDDIVDCSSAKWVLVVEKEV